jgi:hypothetical protein
LAALVLDLEALMAPADGSATRDVPEGARLLTGATTWGLQAYLVQRNIQHTVRYTELSPTRFNDF